MTFLLCQVETQCNLVGLVRLIFGQLRLLCPKTHCYPEVKDLMSELVRPLLLPSLLSWGLPESILTLVLEIFCSGHFFAGASWIPQQLFW